MPNPVTNRFRVQRSPSTSAKPLQSDHEKEFQKAENVGGDGSDFSPGTDESEPSLGNQRMR